MLKNTLVSIVVLLSLLPLKAAQKVEKHDENFATGGRKIALVLSKDGLSFKEELSSFFSECGSIVVDNYFAQFVLPTVKMVKGDLANSQNGYSITVRKSRILIKYTSLEAARASLDYLETMFESPQGKRLLRGENVLNLTDRLNDNKALEVKGRVGVFAKSGVVDGVSRHLNNATISSSIEKLPIHSRKNPIVAIASNDIFRANMECFKLFNPSKPFSVGGDQYNVTQIKNLLNTARTNRINLALGMDLLSPNERFEQWAGHSMNSVEGMRVVRAMIEEMASVWGVRRLCVGDSRAIYAKDGRYLGFLKEICQRNSVEMIML